MSQSRVVKGADLAASRRRRSRRTRRIAAGALALAAFVSGAVVGLRSREHPYQRLGTRYTAAWGDGDYARMGGLSARPRRPRGATLAPRGWPPPPGPSPPGPPPPAPRQRPPAETATVRAWHFGRPSRPHDGVV